MMLALLSFISDATSQPQCIHQFFGLTPWYQYLNLNADCTVNLGQNGLASAANWNQLWLIGVALLDDLLKVGGVVAVVFVLYGGFRYVTSQGNPENTKAAWGTIFNALVGLVVAVAATEIVNFIGNKLGGSETVNGLPNIVADSNTVTDVLNIFFAVLGAIAVIMIVFGGWKYVISRGEAQATAQAKDTILYALIGLAVCLFASAVVNVVLIQFK